MRRVLTLLAGLLVVKVTIAIMLGYSNYFPPNFDSDFLRGREDYFFGRYQWAFYPHIASGPISLILGLILISEQFRLRYPKWHRYLGRIQGLCVLFVVAPSGLYMAYYSVAGPIGAVGLGMLGILTATCVALGWRAAVQRRFADHRRWMWRTFLLLCSAVVLRIVVGMATVMKVDVLWFDSMAVWISWLLPLTAFELSSWRNKVVRHSLARQS